MELGAVQQFLHRKAIGIMRGMGIGFALVLPLSRYLYPDTATDPMWIRGALSALLFGLVGMSFFWKQARRHTHRITSLFCLLLSAWMLGLTLANHLAPEYACSYFIVLFTFLLLIRDWRWLLAAVGLNGIAATVGVLVVVEPVFNPITFLALTFAILLIASGGLVTGWLEGRSITNREQRLRAINRAAYGNATEAILVTDPEGRVLDCNAMFRDYWQAHALKPGDLSVEAWMPKVQTLLVNPTMMVGIAQRAFGNPNETVHETLVLQDGRHIKLLSRPVVETAEILGRIWFFRDVTAAQMGTQAQLQTQERLRRQNATLVQLAMQDSANVSDFQASMQQVTQEVAFSIEADRVGIWRLDVEAQNLVCEDIYFRTLDQHQGGAIVSAGQNPLYFGQIATERFIHLPDASRNPLTAGFKLPYLSGYSERNALDVPLRISGKLHGVLSAECDGLHRDWSVEDQQFLASVGDLVATFFESAERRKAEARLASSIALLKAVFESTGVGILVTRLDRSVLDCNTTYLNIFRLDREFALHGSADEVVAYCRSQVVDPQTLADSMRFLLQNPKENHAQNLLFKDGRIVERFTEVLQVSQEVIGRVWFYRDVTERVRAEQALLESGQRNKAIIEAIPDLMLRMTAEGKILDLKMPEAGPIISGAGEINALTSLFPAEFAEEVILHAQKALLENTVVEYETELSLDGQLRDFEARLAPSGPGEALLMLRDVTERKTTERELRQRNHELDSFVYRASHDLKAPLNSLMGLIEILKNESQDSQLAAYLQLMDKSVLKLDTFIRNLTDFSKIARLEMRNQPVDFQELFAEVDEGLRYMQNSERVKRIVEIMEGPAFVGDSFHIGIVLGNLMSNAIKYQDLKKADAWVKVRVAVTASECVLVVEDNGVGIPAVHQDRIFELFYRASNQSFGSGLGLYITRNAVEKMKGTITLETVEGVGTKFTVVLPNV